MKGKSTLNNIGPLSQGVWILDLGAIDHITPFPKLFISYFKITREKPITVVNGDSVPTCKSKNITLQSCIVFKGCVICHYIRLELLNNFFLLLCISIPFP